MYSLKTTKIENGKGYWNYTNIEIFRNEEKVFEFIRKYNSYAETSTKFFTLNNKDYVVYSSDYQTLSFHNLTDNVPVVLTPESKKNLFGMCPVEVYIPQYKVNLYDFGLCYYPDMDWETKDVDYEECKNSPIQYHDFAFVSGCYWGDDNGWKINLLDLSGIEQGEIYYVTKLVDGEKKTLYQEMPDKITLKDSVSIDYWGQDEKDLILKREDIKIDIAIKFRLR